MLILSNFVEKLDYLLFDAKTDKKSLAESLNVHTTTLYKYAEGICVPSCEVLVKIADYFHCTVDYLVGREVENSAKSFLPCPPFHTRFRFLLTHFHKTKSALCKEKGFAHATVYCWQNGKKVPSLDSLIKLAEFFDCSIDYVLGREN